MQQPQANLVEAFCTLNRNPDSGGVLSSETHNTLDEARCVEQELGGSPTTQHPGTQDRPWKLTEASCSRAM